MELRQLRYFIAVAETLNFTKAAERLHISQPPLSRQIRQLEEEFGVTLFIRDRRNVELTDNGRVFLQEVRAVVNQADWAVNVLQRSKRGEYGTVRIAIASGLSSPVKRVLVEHARRFPKIDVQCTDILSGLQNQALRERRVDVGFLRPPIDTKFLISQWIFDERFLVYLSKNHRLAKRKRLWLRDVASEPLLLYERSVSSGVYDKTLELYRRAGITPRIIPVGMAAYEEAGTLLVASGKGIYLGVGAVLGHPLRGSGVSAVPLAEPDATVQVHMAWRKNEDSALVRAFLDSARRVFKK